MAYTVIRAVDVPVDFFFFLRVHTKPLYGERGEGVVSGKKFKKINFRILHSIINVYKKQNH